MKVVALTGRARTGKNYAAELLFKVLKGGPDGPAQDVMVSGFAAPLRVAAAAVAEFQGLHHFDVERDKGESLLPGVTARAFMQAFGSACREVDPLCWARAILARIEYNDTPDWLLLTDLRYQNEAQWVRGLGGIVVQTTRAPAGAVGGIAGHASEAGIPLELIDYQLDNTQSDAITMGHWRIILRDAGWL